MDEFGSPILGGVRAVRRNLSSSFLSGGQRNPQVDTVTTNLLQQQSLQLTSVSDQLKNISRQISLINFNLKSVKENISLNEQLEKQREDARKNRERILAEQGLREGKESELEKKIQTSLFAPVARIGQKTRGVLEKLTSFLLTLAGGWLTLNGLDLLKAMSEGNVDKINKFKVKFLGNLALTVGSLTAISFGVKKAMTILGVFTANVSRIALGGILTSSLLGIRLLFSGLIAKGIQLALGGGSGDSGRPRTAIDTALDIGSVIGGSIIFNAITDRIGKLFNFNSKVKVKTDGSKGRSSKSGKGKGGGGTRGKSKKLEDVLKFIKNKSKKAAKNPIFKRMRSGAISGAFLSSLFILSTAIDVEANVQDIEARKEAGLITEDQAREEKISATSQGVGSFIGNTFGLKSLGTGLKIAKLKAIAAGGVVTPEVISTVIGSLVLSYFFFTEGGNITEFLSTTFDKMRNKDKLKENFTTLGGTEVDDIGKGFFNVNLQNENIDVIKKENQAESIFDFKEGESTEFIFNTEKPIFQNNGLTGVLNDGKGGTGEFLPNINFNNNSKMFFNESLLGVPVN
tara:strand:- start:5758 stop:7470 length:1713 start_codon:yes stop_codon:yes gene_type:complete